MTLLDSETDPTFMNDSTRLIQLPAGMIGLPETKEFELVANEETLPIMWLRSVGGEQLNFPVVEPGPFVPNYELELNDADAEFLHAASEDEAPLVLTVLTVKSLEPQKATINLLGPIVINRRTLVGKQVLLSNCDRYSVEHSVIDETEAEQEGLC